jgi:mannose-6-phosphate isomerase-like protein (cupin superfamily)
MSGGRLLVLGQDADGRSCIVEERELVPAAVPGVEGTYIASLHKVDQSPPPPCPPGLGIQAPDGLAPGHIHWYIVDHEPVAQADFHNAGTDLHQRNALEMVLIMSGGGDMLLDDGSHPVRAGDCIVMPGSSHGLLTGPEGCKLMAFAVGTPPAS